MSILERVRIRINDDTIKDDLLNEYITTATDRVNLRFGVNTLPNVLESIVVDVVMKMHRRMYYEGIASEGADTLSTSFVDDILAEYTEELNTYKDSLKNTSKVVRFL